MSSGRNGWEPGGWQEIASFVFGVLFFMALGAGATLIVEALR